MWDSMQLLPNIWIVWDSVQLLSKYMDSVDSKQ